MLMPIQKKWLTLALCVGLVLAVLIALSYFVPLYEDICEQSEKTGAKECTPSHLVTYALWQFGKALDAASVAITALATIAIGFFTYILYKATNRQAQLTRDAIELGNREFSSTHRPKLRVRKVTLYQLVDGSSVTVQYEIVNIGDTDAILTFADANVGTRRGGGNRLGSADYQGPRTIRPGETFLVRFDTSLVWQDSSIYSRLDLDIWGKVNYSDANKIERRTEFERFPERTGETNQFVRAEKPDPDYEYED
jgi:hypothetical protein